MPLLAAVAFALPVILALVVFLTTVGVPMYDEWIWSPLVIAAHDGTLRFADLWLPQGAHRSVVPTAIALALARIDGWDPRIEALAGIAFAALAQTGIWLLFRRRLGGAARAGRPFVIASVLLYSLAQSENWVWGFQLSWFIVNAGVVWTIVLLDDRSRSARHFALAAVAASIASFSLIFGFASWIAGAVVLAMQSFRRRLLVWLVLGAIVVAVFLRGYALPSSEHGWVGFSPRSLIDGVQFVLAYLGGPLGGSCTRWVSELLGLAVLLAVAGFVHEARRQRRDVAPWVAFAVFALVAAVMEAVGRAGNGVDAALAYRYTTPATLAWIGLVGLVAERGNAPWRRPALARSAWIVATALFVIANIAGSLVAVQLLGMQRATAAAFLDLSAHDDDDLAQYAADPDVLRSQAARLAAVGLGPWRASRLTPPAVRF